MDINTVVVGTALKFIAADLVVGQVVPVKKLGVVSTVDTAVVLGKANDTVAYVAWDDGNGTVIQEAQVHISSVSKPDGDVLWELVTDKYNACRRVYTEGNGEMLSDVDEHSRRIWKAKEMVTIEVVGQEMIIKPEGTDVLLGLIDKYQLPKETVKEIFLAGATFMAAKLAQSSKDTLEPIDK